MKYVIMEKDNFSRKQVENMTYNEAMQYMEQVQKKGSVLGLGPVQMLLERLDNPQDKLSVIHVAGTNGKGSICTFLESMYRAEGKRVGRYISPTIHCYLERFQINGTYMPEDVFSQLLEMLIKELEVMEKNQDPLPTAFEIETVIAFLYFLREDVDIVILETGMGGRLDATNVINKPLCTVFASIGMDHMQFLGDTIEKIAYEKAGILKAGCPAVSYPNAPEVTQVLNDCFETLNSESGFYTKTEVLKDDIIILSETLDGSRFVYKGETYEIGLTGTYQIYNAVTAIETKLLIDGHLMKTGLKEAAWEGRFEKIADEPLFVRDGAHNVDGVMALKESIEKHFTNHRIIFIIGVLEDKEYDRMMQILCPQADYIFTITPPSERALSGKELKECVLSYCKKVQSCECVEDAVDSAKEIYRQYSEAKEQAVIIAWGSLSYIGHISVDGKVFV